MGLKITNFFANSSYEDDQTQIIVCTECLSHLCLSSLVISDKFWGQSGEAYLVDQLINVLCAMDDLETQMKTGLYVINKIKCQQCSSPLGWVYKKSHNISEAGKEGKFVIERKYIHLIPNNLAFSFLAEQAKKLRRKRSSVSTLVSDDDSISLYLQCDSLVADKSLATTSSGRPAISHFRDSLGLRRSHFCVDKDHCDEHGEEANVFVDM